MSNSKMGRVRASVAGVTLMVAACLAQATLLNRGGGLIYDTDLNVTWLQDANYAFTTGYSTALNGSGVRTMTWTQSTTWAANLSYYDSVRGLTWDDWRLPSTSDVGNDGCNYSGTGGTDCGAAVAPGTSEMAHLFYVELGNLSYYWAPGTNSSFDPGNLSRFGDRLINRGPFTNFQAAAPSSFAEYEWNLPYWSSQYRNDSNGAWYFNFGGGSQSYNGGEIGYFAMAVRDGDVAAGAGPSTGIPEPDSMALGVLALLALGWARRFAPRR